MLDDDDAVLFGVNDVNDAARVMRGVLADRRVSGQRAARLRDRALALFTIARTAATWQRLYRNRLEEGFSR